MPGGLASSLRSRWSRLDRYDLAAGLLLAALLAVASLIVRDYAVSNDEEVQHRYGELVLAYYGSGFADQSVFHYKNLYLYGGLFDVAAILIGRVVSADIFLVRHVLCALIGVGGIAACWATARLIAGPRAGLIAALALSVCGPWFGGMFNHTKDIPFAAAMMGAVYFLLRASRDLPNPRLRHSIGFGLMLGAALGLRALGLLLLFYAAVAIVLALPRPFAAGMASRFVARSLIALVPGFVLAYLMMIAAWPWAALEPFNPIRGLFAFGQFHYPIKTLFAGQTYMMAEVPWYYVPAYLIIKLPLAVLLGVALALMLSTGAVRSNPHPRETAFVGFVALFPVFAEVLSHGPAFSGMRHFMFVLPPLGVLTGIGFDTALRWIEARQRVFAMAAATAIGVGLFWPANVLVRLHPYEYLFFNPIVGGLQGAQRSYDTDYWVNVMHEAVAGLEGFLDREGKPQPARRYFVAVCGERLPFEKEAEHRNRLQWATDDDPADFFIAPTHQDCDTAIGGKIIVTVERMGVPIGVVKDRRHLLQAGGR